MKNFIRKWLGLDEIKLGAYINAIQGDVAHDAVDSGNPLKIGANTKAYGSSDSVAAGDRTNLLADRLGLLHTISGAFDTKTIEASYSAAQTNTAVVAVSTGSKIVVTQVQVINDSFSPNVVSFRVGFATATTPTTTGVVATHAGMIPGAVYSRGDGDGILGVGADDEDLRITSDAPGTGGEIRILVTYYVTPS